MKTRNVGVVVLLMGLATLVMSGVFIWQSFAVSNQITTAMEQEKITYDAEGIEGVIDTNKEAGIMLDVMREHRFDGFPPYSETERDDPRRQTILNALTIEAYLTIAQMGYGISTIAQGIGAFMAVVGVAFVALGIVLRRLE